MTKSEILQKFLNLNIEIKSTTKLKEYIKFCFDKNQYQRIKGKTSHHHILPKSLFHEFKELKK